MLILTNKDSKKYLKEPIQPISAATRVEIIASMLAKNPELEYNVYNTNMRILYIYNALEVKSNLDAHINKQTYIFNVRKLLCDLNKMNKEDVIVLEDSYMLLDEYEQNPCRPVRVSNVIPKIEKFATMSYGVFSNFNYNTCPEAPLCFTKLVIL